MQSKGTPSHSQYSHFLCEEAVITNVNRKTWTATVETVHTRKTIDDVQIGATYLDDFGSGLYAMPEVGTRCYLASPNDNTPPFVMAFRAEPAAISAKGDTPIRSTGDPKGSSTDVSYRSNRPDLNPGDIALRTRDDNFLVLRRGGVLQIGATSMAQRIYIPVQNWIKDFAQNYEMATPAGSLSWTVDVPELDPLGKAACTWDLLLNEYATDKKATVRVRHLPLGSGNKAAWEVTVAKNGIDEKGASSPSYTMVVMTDGTQTEVIGANRSVEVKGDDSLTVKGNQTVEVSGNHELSAKNVTIEASTKAILAGAKVALGSANAMEPAMKGLSFMSWLSSAVWIVNLPTLTATIDPGCLSALQGLVLSQKITLE